MSSIEPQIRVQHGARGKDIGTRAQSPKMLHPGLMSFGTTLYELSLEKDEKSDGSSTHVNQEKSKDMIQDRYKKFWFYNLVKGYLRSPSLSQSPTDVAPENQRAALLRSVSETSSFATDQMFEDSVTAATTLTSPIDSSPINSSPRSPLGDVDSPNARTVHTGLVWNDDDDDEECGVFKIRLVDDLWYNEVKSSVPRFWYVGQPMPDFNEMYFKDLERLRKQLKVHPNGSVQMNFPFTSPFWDFRCAFAEFFHSARKSVQDDLVRLQQQVNDPIVVPNAEASRRQQEVESRLAAGSCREYALRALKEPLKK